MSHIKWPPVDSRDRWLHPLSHRNSNMNWLDGVRLWVLCKLGVHASLASRYARFLEQRSEHSLTTSLTCPASRTQMAVSTTEASHTRHGSLVPGSACPNPGPAEALRYRSRRLRCQRCGGMRSRTYHWRHYHGPIAYPAIGVCSRRRTKRSCMYQDYVAIFGSLRIEIMKVDRAAI